MKKTLAGFLVITVLSILTAPPLHAAEQEQKLHLTGTLDFGYYSRYIGGTSGATVLDRSVFQQSVTVALEPLGLYFCLWDSYSPKGSPNSDPGDEMDYYLGFKRTFGGVTINAGYAYYNLQNLKNTHSDLHAVFAGAEFPKLYGLVPYVFMEQDIAVHGSEGGFFYRAGVAHTRNILSQPINFNLSVAGHDACFGLQAEPISSTRLTISSDFKLKSLTITPIFNFQKRLGHRPENGGIAEDKFRWGVNISLPLF